MNRISQRKTVLFGALLGLVLITPAWQRAGAITITNHFDTDPLWTGFNNMAPSNNYGYSASTSVAGGLAGEVGGTFARRAAQNFYADTNMGGLVGGHFTLGHALQGSGRLDATNTAAMNNSVLVGHLSAGTTDRSFVGAFVSESNVNIPTMIRVQPALILSDNTFISVTATNAPIGGDYWFSYSYSPTGGANSQGQLSLTFTNATFAYFASVDLTAAHRAIGAKLDAFGMYQPPVNDTFERGDVFIDDVTYTAVPEPSTLALLGAGALLLLRRRSS